MVLVVSIVLRALTTIAFFNILSMENHPSHQHTIIILVIIIMDVRLTQTHQGSFKKKGAIDGGS